MKDLLERILKYIPGFLHDYVTLVTGPRAFFEERLTEKREDYVKGLVFLGVSFSLVFLLAWFRLAPEREFSEVFVFGFVVSLFFFALLAAALIVTGKLFGMMPATTGLLMYLSFVEGTAMFLRAVVYTVGLMFVRTLSDSFYRFMLLGDTYVHFVGARSYINSFVDEFQEPDPATEALSRTIILVSLGIGLLFSLFVYGTSWRVLFPRYASSGKVLVAFVVFFSARLLVWGF
jgi:hypothetical protein